MLVFAHRGYSAYYPENTMLAFQKAYEVGVAGIELDVQMTKDGVLVITHDEQCQRCMGDARFVKDLTFEELSKLNAGASFKYDLSFLLEHLGSQEKVDAFFEQEAYQAVPTLEQYLAWAKDKNLVTNIELKTGVFAYHGIEPKAIDLVKAYGLEDKVIFSSFNHYTMTRVKALDPQMKCGLLTMASLVDAGTYCKNLGMEAYHPFFPTLNVELCKNLMQEGIELNIYTVNQLEHLSLLLDFPIHIVMTNYPEAFMRFLESKGKLG